MAVNVWVVTLTFIGTVGLLGAAVMIASVMTKGVNSKVLQIKMLRGMSRPRGSAKNRYVRGKACKRLCHIFRITGESSTKGVVDSKEPATAPLEERVDALETAERMCLHATPLDDPPVSDKAGVHHPFGTYPLPLTDKAAVNSMGLVYQQMADDHDVAIKHLEEEQFRVVTQLEKCVNNITKVLSLLETMADRILDQEREINSLNERTDELKDKLNDSIFILYGGKKPDGE